MFFRGFLVLAARECYNCTPPTETQWHVNHLTCNTGAILGGPIAGYEVENVEQLWKSRVAVHIVNS